MNIFGFKRKMEVYYEVKIITDDELTDKQKNKIRNLLIKGISRNEELSILSLKIMKVIQKYKIITIIVNNNCIEVTF